MFKITSIEIKGFWGKHVIACELDQHVNIIIGNNGTGKTTFMNILNAVLSVDSEGLYENDFTEVTIKLSDKNKSKTIRATKQESETTPFPVVTYYISKHKYILPVIVSDDARTFPLAHRRRSLEDSAKIRAVLNEVVHLASLSVYRLRQDPDIDARERSRKSLSPVDARLQELRQKLTQYQLELSDEARKISTDLQKNVLVSLLYNGERSRGQYSLEFDEAQEKQSLILAYRQLGLSGSDITNRIQRHISAVSSTITSLRDLNNSNSVANFASIEARERTREVIKLSLDAEKKMEELFSQVNAFLKTIVSFIPAKQFAFVGGELTVTGPTRIALPKLSSGEKQLLILLIEALLQKQKSYIFLADEPELSLHIQWQRKIIPAIVAINPNAQVIVATHSPEIAGKFSNSIIDMEDILHG